MWTALRINIYPRWAFHYSRLFKHNALGTRKQLILSLLSNVFVMMLRQLAGLTFVEITVQKPNQVTQKWFTKELRITTPSIATFPPEALPRTCFILSIPEVFWFSYVLLFVFWISLKKISYFHIKMCSAIIQCYTLPTISMQSTSHTNSHRNAMHLGWRCVWNFPKHTFLWTHKFFA